MKYVTRRRTVEAVRYDGTNAEEILKFAPTASVGHEGLMLKHMLIYDGWYIIDDPVLGFRRVSPEDFIKLYTKPRQFHRDSVTGRFTTKQYADDNKDTTQKKTA